MAINYQMKLGDCIFCIVYEQGLLPVTVWKHTNNALLREKRQEIKNCQPGDVVFIPDLQPKVVKEPTNQVHKFRTKWEKHLHWIEIELVGEDGKPHPNEKYQVKLPDGSLKDGALDQDGWARVETFLAGDCEVTFPELDKTAWEFIERIGPKSKSS